MLVTLAATVHRGVDQQFAVAFPGRLSCELHEAGGHVHVLPPPRASRPLTVWRARRAFASVLEAASPGLVICHGAWPHAMFAATVRSAGVRLAFWQHQPIVRMAWPDRWARLVRPDFCLFNSAFTGAHPAFPSSPGTVIHCPVARPPRIGARARREGRAALGVRDEDVVVLTAARFEPWKGQEVLLQAMRELPRSTRVHAWVAGGAQTAAESRFARTLADSTASPELRGRVTLLGERRDVPVLMRLADVYCQPNLRAEPFGIAIAEAMSAGLPCAVSAPGGAAEMLDGTCGCVTPPGDAGAVSRALLALATDPALRARLGRAAAARARRLTDPVARLDQLASCAGHHAS
jgi:glycosyltransferase involved in cell wall biosynthesis